MPLKRINFFKHSNKKEKSCGKRTGSESTKVKAETCEQRRSFFRKTKTVGESLEKKRFASAEEDEEIPKKRTSFFGQSEKKDERLKKRMSLESREKAEGTKEMESDSSNKSANEEKKWSRRSWLFTQHDESQTMRGKELNLLSKREAIDPVKTKVLTRSKEEEQNTEKRSDVPGKSKANEEKAHKKSSSFSLSKKASQKSLDATRRRHSWDPKIYIRRVRVFLGMTLNIIFLSTISCWHRIHTSLKSTEAHLLRIFKTSLSFMVQLTPKKIFKYFMVYFCHFLPGLRNRWAVLYVFNSAPAWLTKKITSAYLKKVPVWMMGWHAYLLLRASPFRKSARNLVESLRLPRKLLETVVMSVVSVLKVLTRTMTYSRSLQPEAAKRQSSLSSWKIKSRNNSACSDQEDEKRSLAID